MTDKERAVASLLGALVADAASLGLHWLYDTNRIAEIASARDGDVAFVPIDAENYAGVTGYFAHAQRQDGMLSQYGEVLRLALRSMINSDGQFDVANYQQEFSQHFGPGGNYCGYIDRPTRGALDNIANEQVSPSGIDDDQLPAVARLPAIVAAYRDRDDLEAMVRTSMEITNVNDVAGAHGKIFANLLLRIVSGEPMEAALTKSAEEASPEIKSPLLVALILAEADSTAFGETTGRACHLPMAAPLSFHILKNASNYRDAVERNILAGGDSAGRSILIGAIMGAAHGIGGQSGIPLDWILKTKDNADIWAECRTVAGY